MTKPLLVDEPEGVDATIVECPTCGASEGWACGDAHCMGAHASRVRAAERWIKISRNEPQGTQP